MYYNRNPRQTLKSVGVNYLFTAELFLSVGETCGLPRANAVRPYRVLVKDFAISPLILHALRSALCFGNIPFPLAERSCSDCEE